MRQTNYDTGKHTGVRHRKERCLVKLKIKIFGNLTLLQ